MERKKNLTKKKLYSFIMLQLEILKVRIIYKDLKTYLKETGLGGPGLPDIKEPMFRQRQVLFLAEQAHLLLLQRDQVLRSSRFASCIIKKYNFKMNTMFSFYQNTLLIFIFLTSQLDLEQYSSFLKYPHIFLKTFPNNESFDT